VEELFLKKELHIGTWILSGALFFGFFFVLPYLLLIVFCYFFSSLLDRHDNIEFSSAVLNIFKDSFI
jgi:hypothetical protein